METAAVIVMVILGVVSITSLALWGWAIDAERRVRQWQDEFEARCRKERLDRDGWQTKPESRRKS